MSYRDDNDGLRERVAALGAELERANEEIARLRGGAPRRAGDVLVTSRITGAPVRYSEERELPFEIDDAGYEAIAALLRARLGLHVSQVGRSLTCPGAFSLTREAGATRVRLSADWSNQVAGVVAGPLLTSLLTGPMVLVALAAAVAGGSSWAALHALWIVPVLGLPVAYGLRGMVRRRTTEALAVHRGTMEAIVSLAEQHRAAAPAVKVRIDAAADEDDAGDALRDEAPAPARQRQ